MTLTRKEQWASPILASETTKANLDDTADAGDALDAEIDELSTWISEGLTMAKFQAFLEKETDGKVNKSIINKLFMDNVKMQDLVAQFADDVARIMAEDQVKG